MPHPRLYWSAQPESIDLPDSKLSYSARPGSLGPPCLWISPLTPVTICPPRLPQSARDSLGPPEILLVCLKTLGLPEESWSPKTLLVSLRHSFFSSKTLNCPTETVLVHLSSQPETLSVHLRTYISLPETLWLPQSFSVFQDSVCLKLSVFQRHFQSTWDFLTPPQILLLHLWLMTLIFYLRLSWFSWDTLSAWDTLGLPKILWVCLRLS